MVKKIVMGLVGCLLMVASYAANDSAVTVFMDFYNKSEQNTVMSRASLIDNDGNIVFDLNRGFQIMHPGGLIGFNVRFTPPRNASKIRVWAAGSNMSCFNCYISFDQNKPETKVAILLYPDQQKCVIEESK